MEIYILPNGQEIDLSNYSQQEKILWLSENTGAKLKKEQGVAASANAMPSNMFAQGQNGDLVSENTLSVSPGSLDINSFQYFNEDPQETEELTNSIGSALGKYNSNEKPSVNRFGLYEDQNIQLAIDGNFINEEDLINAGYKDDPSGLSAIKPVTAEQRLTARNKIATYQSKSENEISSYVDILKLNEPYIYEDKSSNDEFVNEIYGDVELDGFNTTDFDGYMESKGYKDDLKRFLELEMDTKSYGTNVDTELSYEQKKLQYLNMYINDQIQRDIKQQQLMYQAETGIDPKLKGVKFNLSEGNIKLQNYENYLRQDFPVLSSKMQAVDEKNQLEYQKLIDSDGNIGAGQFLLNIGGNGLNGLSDAISQFSASVYGALPGDYFEGIAEQTRQELLLEEMGLDTDGTFYTGPGRFVSGIGKSIIDKDTGTKYLVTENGRIFDKDRSLDATNFLSQQKANQIRKEARKRGVKDNAFSVLGAFDSGANVVGDLFFQIALTRSIGNGIRSVGGFTAGLGVLGKTKGFLKSIPIKKSMGDAIIGQSTLGFSRGYEETLSQARKMGLNDNEASELAAIASVQTGILYALTAPISPQTKATDAIFGKLTTPNIVGNALKEYTKKGKKGFLDYFRTGKLGTLVNVGGEGIKEVFQENVQQSGEMFVVNKNTNDRAARKIMKDTISLQDFIDTTVLSFFAGAIIPGAGVTLNLAKKTARDMLGMSNVDRFNNLSYLSYNKEKVKSLLATQVEQGIYTQQEADQVIEEMNVFNDNINRMPQDLSADAATEILGDVNEVGKLRQQRKTESPSFHAETDKRIKELDDKIQRAYYNDITKRKSGVIVKAIKKGVIKNISWNEFESTDKVVDFLVNELNYTKAKAVETASKYGIAVQRDGKQYILINNEKSAKDGKITVKEHEFLHAVIYETIKNDTEAQVLLGRSLLSEVLKLQDKINLTDSDEKALPEEFLQDYAGYIAFYNKLIKGLDLDLKSGIINKIEYDNKVSQAIGNQWEEVLTLYSDAITVGAVSYDQDTMTRLGDVLRQVLQFLGLKDIKFSSAKDVYNFIKDYNNSINNRILSIDKNRSIKKLATKGTTIDKEALKTEIKKSENKFKKEAPKEPILDREPTIDEIEEIEDIYNFDEKFSLKTNRRYTQDEFQAGINSLYNKNKWEKPSGIDAVLYDVLSNYEKIILDKAYSMYSQLPDYSSEDMLAETTIALIPHIRNFNKEFLQLRSKKRKELQDKGLSSSEINSTLNKLDEKGYTNSKGVVVKENNNLNGWINSQLRNKMKVALKSGNVTSQQYTDEIDEKITSIETTNPDVLDQEKQEYEKNQDELVVLLKNPNFGFSNKDGKPILIEGVPVGGDFAITAEDPSIAVNRKLKTVSDPAIKSQLEQEKRDLKRGLELESKESLSNDEVKELKELKSFKTYSLASGGMIKTYKAYSEQINPAAIIAAEVRKEIISSPNIETLNFRSFKKKLALLSQTLTRRMTFQNSKELESFMFNNWKLIWDVINNPIDPVTGESTYAIKKIPPRLKQTNDKGFPIKTKNINVASFLQNYFGLDEATRIIQTFSKNPNTLIKKLSPIELGKTGNKLWSTAYFDRRTALMELFGDVVVLQEARKSIKNDAFINEISKRNPGLANDLKDSNIRSKVLNNLASGKSSNVKFSLKNGSKNNSKITSYLKSTNNIDEQLFLARILDKATSEVIKYNRKAIKFNVPDLGKMNDKAVSYYLINKISQGYNDFYFKNDKNWKGKESRNVLDTSDVKFSLNNDRNELSSNLSTAFNQIIEENSGIPFDETFSKARAENMGRKLGKEGVYLPSGDSDFLGLMYMIASAKGKKGEKQLKWLDDNLISLYSQGVLDMINARNAAHRDWKNLFDKPTKKLIRKESSYAGFTNDQAIRVYLWKKAGFEISDLDNKDIFNLSEVVRNNPSLRKIAQEVSRLSKQPGGYLEPPRAWQEGNILTDIQNILSKVNRLKYLTRFKQNVDLIFSKENINKLEATLGEDYVEALQNILDRMISGSNRPDIKSKNSRAWVDWLNGSIGVTMFFNMRSASLQLLSSTNFINMDFNNPIAAGKALLNLPQMQKDFLTLWNSPYLKDRRSGLLSDLQESEIVDVVNNPNNKNWIDKSKGLIFWALKKGFIPTRAADSLAITLGGTTFYRNRINDLVKKGMELEAAEKQAFKEFYETAEMSQQSADPSKISKNQASIEGRLFLSFQNTPLQYSRIMKKSFIDIAKGRGNAYGHVAKIAYYAAVQNVVFNFLQNALFRMWDDPEDRDLTRSKSRAVQGSIDTLLKGAGLYGTYFAAIKNVMLKVYQLSQEERGGRGKAAEILVEALQVMPPVGIKARKIERAWNDYSYNTDYFDEYGWNPIKNKYATNALTTLTAATLNVPLDRLYQKSQNLAGAMDSSYDTWERIAMFSGYSKWNLDLADEQIQQEGNNNELDLGVDLDLDLNLDLNLDLGF